ncbi:MAG: weak similarity to aminoglycoside phosphotransferase [uncultured Nocardioides sp.]|uniref:Weak similarity to aminoglycoside phosphotransferase n=1 Tax=uncultured Nocardioides sp. TaxID=198441 RepID=A0A6J4P3N8_9ACTN|nr:MAG: weak similarity to aminoglycoside phosphotransferase [uncultured Nocardioides sp.]
MSPTRVQVPPGLDEQRGLGPDWARWLDRLPARAGGLVEEWELTPVGDPLHGYTSLVLPVTTADGERAALKVTFDGDEESEHEGLALQRWGGRGAVRLLRADPHRRALLLEWLDGCDLLDAWDVEACEVVGALYADLHVQAPPQLRTVASYVGRWLDGLERHGRDVPVPRRYVDQALSLGRDLVADTGGGVRLVHGDLHYANVMAAGRAPWLAIDPKPMSGDPHYEPAPMLWNRMAELGGPAAVGSLRDGLRRRFLTLVDAAGLDEDRARDWVVVRMVLNAGWAVDDARRAGRGLTRDERDWITRCVAVTKAVQD